MTTVYKSEGRHRQVEIRAGYRALFGANSMYLHELREAVKETEGWPENCRVRVEKSSLVGDRLKITDSRSDWGEND